MDTYRVSRACLPSKEFNVLSKLHRRNLKPQRHFCGKAAQCEIQKTLNFLRNIVCSSFGSMFRVFHLAWSTCRATKTLVASWRNIEMRRADWLICLVWMRDKLWVWWKTKPKFVTQSRPALYFSQQLSLTRNKCSWCAISWSRKVKSAKYRPKTCNETLLRHKFRERFFVSTPP